MRPTDEHQTPSTRPSFMASTGRPAPASDNILARLDRNGGGTARTPWSRTAKIGVAGALLLTLALTWLLIGLTQENLEARREAQVVVAMPTETQTAAAPAQAEPAPAPAAEIALDNPAQAPAPAALEPASLEPVPVLPMLADVVEKAPAAPAPRAAPRPHPRQARTGTPRPSGKAGATPQAAPAAVGADPATENDVALLSAILLHSPRHRAERARAEAKCNLDKKCTVAGPLPALLKATE